MTAKIETLYQHPAIRRDIAEALIELNNKINDAINDGIEAGVPLILISAILQAEAQVNTVRMMEMEDE